LPNSATENGGAESIAKSLEVDDVHDEEEDGW
jgi:hypothetical protein